MSRLIIILLIVFVVVDHFALEGFYLNAGAGYVRDLGAQTSSEVDRMLKRD